jgi:hydroxymethylglutaryl-CoA reductase (NADPH)
MPGVPAFILRRLYVRGSLQNTTTGWCFTLKNSLGSGYAHGMVPLRVDETEEVPMDRTTFENDGVTISFDQVNEENTFGLQMNRSIIISVFGEQLSRGAHRIDFACIVPGLGQIGFDFVDEVDGA